MVYYMERAIILSIGIGMALAAGPRVFADSSTAITWNQVDREFSQFLQLEQKDRLQRWDAVLRKDFALSQQQTQQKLLDAGKKELAHLLKETSPKWSWSTTAAARIQFYLKTGRASWKLRFDKTEQATLLGYLETAYSDPADLTALEWKKIAIVYGIEVQRALLMTTFTPEPWRTARAVASSDSFHGNTAEVVYVEEGHQWAASGKDLQEILASSPNADILRKDVEHLKTLGIVVHKITLPTYPEFDDQARELEHLFSRLKETTDAPLVLLSGGIASAVVYRWLDIFPNNRESNDVRAWINWNGRLYGTALDSEVENILRTAEKGTKASRSPAALNDWSLAGSMVQPQKEAMEPALPLGPGFPIFNFLALHWSDRPAKNLREAIVPEGKTFVAHQPWSGNDLSHLLRRALNP